MSAPGFAFPPPPPPPLRQTPSIHDAYPLPTYPHNGFRGRAAKNNRGDRGSGRGNSSRGSRGGGNRGFLGYGGYSSPANGAFNRQGPGNGSNGYPLPDYALIQQPQYASYPSLPQNHPHQYPPNTAIPYPPHSAYATSGPDLMPCLYGAILPNTPQDEPRVYHDGHSNMSHVRPPRQRYEHQTAGGTPIRLGFGNDPQVGPQTPVQHLYRVFKDDNTSYGGRDSNPQTRRRDPRQPPPSSFETRQKRVHSDAFGNPHKHIPRLTAAPAVPSFGIPLPSKPPVLSEQTKKSRKKRKYNQLGLTPKTEEHESSEEDDGDEEAKLVSALFGGAVPTQQLQFTYNGQTATLKSSSDIALWIAERKERYPTKKRVEEANAMRKKAKQEAQRVAQRKKQEADKVVKAQKQEAERVAKQAHDMTQQEKKRKKKKKQEAAENAKVSNPDDVEAKLKYKAEKLRKQYEKAQKLVIMMEAKKAKAMVEIVEVQGRPSSLCGGEGVEITRVENSRLEPGMPGIDSGHMTSHRLETVTSPQAEANSDILNEKPLEGVATSGNTDNVENSAGLPAGHDPLTPTSQPFSREDSVSASISLAPNIQVTLSPAENACSGAILDDNAMSDKSSMSLSTTSSDLSSEDEDTTSSSGTSSNEDPPNEMGSNSTAPLNIRPPKGAKKATICKMFLRTGFCKRGITCLYRHELPERGKSRQNAQVSKYIRRKEQKPERVTLYQRLVAQEKEKENELVLQSNIYLREQGLLDGSRDMLHSLDDKAKD